MFSPPGDSSSSSSGSSPKVQLVERRTADAPAGDAGPAAAGAEDRFALDPCSLVRNLPEDGSAAAGFTGPGPDSDLRAADLVTDAPGAVAPVEDAPAAGVTRPAAAMPAILAKAAWKLDWARAPNCAFNCGS